MAIEEDAGQVQSLIPAASGGTPADDTDESTGVIDLLHLRRYTLGDATLEQEILSLFADHACATLSLLKSADNEATRRQEAHALKGSALAVGAWEVARLAQAAEASASNAAALADVAADLAVAIGEARNFITAHQNGLR